MEHTISQFICINNIEYTLLESEENGYFLTVYDRDAKQFVSRVKSLELEPLKKRYEELEAKLKPNLDNLSPIDREKYLEMICPF